MDKAQKITAMLWFDNQAEEAVKFYTSIFKNSRIGATSRYGEGGMGKKGSVMTIEFEIEGQQFTALNGGPQFKFNEAVSFVVNCETQEEIDYYWEELTAGGGKEVQCGWLTDKYGVSWQVVPTAVMKMIEDKDQARADRVMQALLPMVKLDLKRLKDAYDGK